MPYHNSEKYRSTMSQVIAQKWQDPEYREKTLSAINTSYNERMKQRLVALAQKAKEEHTET